MADENAIPAATGGAAPTPAAAPVDPNAAALALFKKADPAADPKAPAPSASSPGGSEAGKAASAPGTAEPAVAEPDAGLKAQREQLSRGFAKLASQRAEIEAHRQELKHLQRWADADTKVKADPAAVLELHGLTLEQVAEAYLKRQAGGQPTVEDRVAQLEAERRAAAEKATKDAEQAQAQSVQEARANGVAAIAGHLQLAADKYPVTLARGEAEHVFDAVMKYGATHGIDFSALPPQTTTELVTMVATAYEEARQAQVDEEISSLAPKVPKLAARFAPPKPDGQTAPSGGTHSGAQASSVTLVGTPSEAPPPQQPTGRLSKAELERRALEVFAKAKQPAA